MLENNFINVFTREHSIGYLGRRIDRDFLIENIVDFNQHFYVCGPDDFVRDINKYLLGLGVTADSLVFEE